MISSEPRYAQSPNFPQMIVRHGRDRMVVGFTPLKWFESRSRWGVLNTTLCDVSNTCEMSMLFFGYSSFPTNKTCCHDISDINLTLTLPQMLLKESWRSIVSFWSNAISSMTTTDFLLLQKYCLWSYWTWQRCPSKCSKEVMFLFGVIRNLRYGIWLTFYP